MLGTFSWGEKKNIFLEKSLNETYSIQKVIFPSYIHDPHAKFGKTFLINTYEDHSQSQV